MELTEEQQESIKKTGRSGYLNGEFFFTGYINTFCDNELTDRCRQLNRFIYADKAVIKHKVLKDEIYETACRGQNRIYDRALYSHRKENNWKTELKFTGEKCIPEFMKEHIGIYQEHLTRYNFALSYVKNKKVLDASCGCGWATDLMYDIAKEVKGIDNDVVALDYAKRNYRGKFALYNLNKQFPNEDFDIVVSMETLEHLKNHELFFKNIKEHSKEFLFSVPINDNNKFHKIVFKNFDEVNNFMSQYFKDIEWFSQYKSIIRSGIRDKFNYLIGYVRNN